MDNPLTDNSSENGALGTCFGFSVVSTLPFSYLRHGGGARLEVAESDREDHEPDTEPLATWEPTELFPFSAKLFRNEDTYDFWLSHWGWFHVDAANRSITLPAADPPELREVCLWALPATVCSLLRKELCLHASCVEVDGKAVIFSAPGQHGKTTLAAAFMQAGHRVLAEDKISIRPGEQPHVLPGPALLRVRPDVYERMEFPGTTLLRLTGNRAYLTFDDELRGSGDPVPLGGIFFVRPTHGELSIEPAGFHESLRDLWAMRKHVPTAESEAFSFEALTDIVQRVPAYDLHRPQRYEALPDVIEKVIETCT